MKKYPALALLELSSIATGISCGDIMIKQSPITVIKSGTVHDGKYLILIGGSVASVEEAYYKGASFAQEAVVDQLCLPDIHEQVHDAILGQRNICAREAIGIIETLSVAATIQSADIAIKSTNIEIVEIRLADHLGGKAFAIFSGKIEEIQTAVEVAYEKTTNPGFWLGSKVIANLHPDMARQIDQSTYFGQLEPHLIDEGEI